MTYAPAAFPSAVRRRLVPALAELHDRDPFGPQDVRASARRVIEVAADLELEPLLVRGCVDVGAAELDHVFVVVEDRVVDVALPVRAPAFAEVVRAWIAGDVDLHELAARASRHGLEDRVVGEYPQPVRYRGAPVWGTAS